MLREGLFMKKHTLWGWLTRPAVTGLLAALGSAVIFLFPSLTHFTQAPTVDHGDFYYVVLILGHWMDVVLRGHWGTWTTLPMMYGVKDTVFLTDHHMLQAVMALPIYLVTQNIVTTANILSVAMMVLSVWAMYIFLHEITKNGWASVIGSVIFVYNPFVYARFPDQMILYTLFFIPLIFLFIEKSIAHPTSKNILLFFLCLTGELFSSLYYSAFLSVIVPVYVLLRLSQTKRRFRDLFRPGAIIGLLLYLAVAGWTYMTYSRVLNQQVTQRSFMVTEYFYAAWPADWLVTAPNFIIWGPVGEQVATVLNDSIRPNSPIEMSLFLGLTPFLLLLISFRVVSVSPYRRLWITFVICLVISFLLSLGPSIHITGSVVLPNIYPVVAWLVPPFGYMRSVSRYAMFVFFFGSIIAAMTTERIIRRFRRSTWIAVLLLILICIEYQKLPMHFFAPSAGTLHVYGIIRRDKSIRTVLELPMISNLDKNLVDSHPVVNEASRFYLQTIHGKAIMGGYSSFMPEIIYERGDLAMIHFPTKSKLELMKQWGVDAIVVHPDEYRDPVAGEAVVRGLEELGVSVIARAGILTAFNLRIWKP